MSVIAAPKICVIGAGPCGLTAIKNALALGFNDVVCYDDNDEIGGNWAYTDNPARTTVYESTHINTSKRLTEFDDFRLPDEYPDFPSHRHMRAYFEKYAAHFGLIPHIRLRTRVEAARRLDDGRWSIKVTGPDGEKKEDTFDYLFVCAGHHRVPFIPESKGKFTGQILHSRDFKRPEPFRDKRVLVIGAGNSACDIAVDIGRVASHTCISMRRGYYIVPKIIFGRPTDIMGEKVRKFFGRHLTQPILTIGIRTIVGPYRKYGLQQPDYWFFETHPTQSTNLLDALRHGVVYARVGIDRFDGRTVHFVDGTSEDFDTIIWCTGFNVSYPFLDASIFPTGRSGPPPLYLKMMHETIPNLFFIGLFQPIGSIWPLADYQARIAMLQIARRLPRPADIAKRIEQEMNSPHWNFKLTGNHAMQVDYHDFRRELLAELKHAAPARAPAA